MSKRKRTRVELRYYEIPRDKPLLALLGDSWKRNYGNDIDFLHFHNLLEIGYCHYGKGVLKMIDGTVYPYGAGTFTFIPQNFGHTTISDTSEAIDYWEFLFIDMDKLIDRYYSDDKLLHSSLVNRINQRAHVLESSDYPHMSRIIQDIIEEMYEPEELTKDIVNSLLLQMFMRITRLNPPEVTDATTTKKAKNQISPALDYLQKNYANQIKIQTLAAACRLSETHFRRLFEDAIAMTPNDYVSLVRIQKACELIKNTNDSMNNIASKTGFTTQSSFNRTFLKIVGMQPLKWKKQGNCCVNGSSYRICPHEGWR